MELHQITPKIGNIKKEKLTDQIFQTLKELILSGQWPEGYKLPSEPDLAEQFGVSRMSVRMALQKLQALGLIEAHAGNGTFVKSNFLDEYFQETGSLLLRFSSPKEIMEFRKALETAGVSLAIQRYTPEQLAMLRIKLDHFFHAISARDPEAVAQADVAFHGYIIEMSGNHLMCTVYKMCVDMLHTYLRKGSNNVTALPVDYCEKHDFADDWHTRLYEAIAAKDTNEAIRISNETIEHSFEAWL